MGRVWVRELAEGGGRGRQGAASAGPLEGAVRGESFPVVSALFVHTSESRTTLWGL